MYVTGWNEHLESLRSRLEARLKELKDAPFRASLSCLEVLLKKLKDGPRKTCLNINCPERKGGECIASQKGIDWTKDNIYDAIGRSDLKPKDDR